MAIYNDHNLLVINRIRLNSGNAEISWQILRGQNWLIRGDMNSGRSDLLALLTGKSYLFEENVINYFSCYPEYGFARLNNHLTYLNFRGMIADHQQYYYQQRYNATESDDIITLRNFLSESEGEISSETEKLIRLFGLRHCLDEEIIKLSSGEYRKASIIRAILNEPEMLVLDEPYAGLDKESIPQMDDLLNYVSQKGTAILLASNSRHIPKAVTHLLILKDHRVNYQGSASEYKVPSKESQGSSFTAPLFQENEDDSFSSAFELIDTTVKYNTHVILDHINWQAGRGSQWVLEGKNGAGKSMLLSLIYADNPQAYANQVYLFDRRRGTGETIWEIKERIGYFSSELFLYYDRTRTTTEAAFRYLSVNPYNRRTASDIDRKRFHDLTGYFNLQHFCDLPLHKVPYEAQRIFMLMNVFLGNAPLIILDEPYHGLDEETIKKMNALLEQFSKSRTLIFVSHDPQEVPSIATSRFHLEKGRGFVIKHFF